MSWVVDDSEDEDNFEASLKPQEPQVQSHSVISDFSTHEIVLPVSNQTSPISNFTTLDNGIHRPDITIDSIAVASMSITAAAGAEPASIKPKRPKPRPAYKGHLESTDGIEQSTSAASVIASAINQIGPGSSRDPIVDATFSLDIAERAKTRKRNVIGSSVRNPSSSRDAGSIIVEGSSKDIIIAISSDGEAEPGTSRVDFTPQSRRQEQARSSQTFSKISHIPASNAPTLLLSLDSSSAIRTTGVPSPLFDWQHQNPGSTPPSSPFQPRKPKRRLLEDDSAFLDDGMGVNDGEFNSSVLSGKDGEPSTKKQKRMKEKKDKKPREGKTKIVVERGDAVTATKTLTKKRAEKSKSASEQPEFKSKEFVDDSDDSEEDDLLLRPNNPSDHHKKSATHQSVSPTSHSDPASMEVSVYASINESVRPSGLTSAPTVEPSASILPSLSLSVGPSASVSEVPCTDAHASACVSASPPVLPPPPSMSRMSEVDRSKSVKKRKKKRVADAHSDVTGGEASVPHNMDLDLGVPAGRSLAGQSDVPIKEPTNKKAGRPKKKKKTEVQSSTADETRIEGASSTSSASCLPPNDTESAEQSISTSTSKETQQHSKKPKGKKHGTIVSSDEDEAEGNPSKAKDNVDPAGVEFDKESRSDDKENEPLPSPPKNRPAQGVSTPHPSTTHQQSPIPDSKLKSRASSSTSTSHNPPRRDSMSALIRRVSSKVHSPLNSPSPSSHSHSHSHSPLAKSSRLALSRIAPLHPNRRTPPPAPPRPPPPKKSKKMLELEEKWEMELAESVDGWACLGDEERAALRRAKRDKELGFDD